MQDELSKVKGKIKTGSEIIDKNSRDVDKLKVTGITSQASLVCTPDMVCACASALL